MFLESFRVFYIELCHLQIVIVLLLHSLFGYLLCLFLALTRTSISVLINCGESGHPCCVPNLKGTVLSFSQLSSILPEVCNIC